jgi:glycosyltransferase involved in cell wall biosynthesis
MKETIQISVVIPCLNEEKTIGVVVAKAFRALEKMGAMGEVIVADNGSVDHSREIAASLGARVICVQARGYGNALRAGIENARGYWVVIGDADDSYDFLEMPKRFAS